MIKKAIFLDRDGTINYPALNRKTGEFEAPHSPEVLKLYECSILSLKKLQSMGYLLFLVSNQPDFVKRKCTLQDLSEVHNRFHDILVENNIKFKDYYYCFHHPSVSSCFCRKPSPFLIKRAEDIFKLNLKESWMVGDRETDVLCGKNAGTKTIKIGNKKSILSDFTATDIKEAAEIIEFCDRINKKEN